MAQRIGHFLERQRLMERDIENSYLDLDAADEDPMQTLLEHSITYRIAVGPQAGRKVFTLQTLPASDQQDQRGESQDRSPVDLADLATASDEIDYVWPRNGRVASGWSGWFSSKKGVYTSYT